MQCQGKRGRERERERGRGKKRGRNGGWRRAVVHADVGKKERRMERPDPKEVGER